jgi:hypothetical protein
MKSWHGGKGSGRRKEDSQRVDDNWGLVFNNKNKTEEEEDSGILTSKNQLDKQREVTDLNYDGT